MLQQPKNIKHSTRKSIDLKCKYPNFKNLGQMLDLVWSTYFDKTKNKTKIFKGG